MHLYKIWAQTIEEHEELEMCINNWVGSLRGEAELYVTVVIASHSSQSLSVTTVTSHTHSCLSMVGVTQDILWGLDTGPTEKITVGGGAVGGGIPDLFSSQWVPVAHHTHYSSIQWKVFKTNTLNSCQSYTNNNNELGHPPQSSAQRAAGKPH